MQTMSIPRQDVTLLAFSVASLDAPLSHQLISSEPAYIIVLLRAHTTEEKEGVPVGAHTKVGPHRWLLSLRVIYSFHQHIQKFCLFAATLTQRLLCNVEIGWLLNLNVYSSKKSLKFTVQRRRLQVWFDHQFALRQQLVKYFYLHQLVQHVTVKVAREDRADHFEEPSCATEIIR